MGWQQQFENSLQGYAASRWPDVRGVNEPVPVPFVHARSMVGQNAFSLAVGVLVREYMGRPVRHLQALLRLCSSPLEEALLYALCILAHRQADYVSYQAGSSIFGELAGAGLGMVIEPQAQLGPFRVDFRLDVLVDGERVRSMVVECDGHDYHFRTKDQAQRDRQRDRFLQRNGFLVFRYTGSEIWADVFECAQEAVGTVVGDAAAMALLEDAMPVPQMDFFEESAQGITCRQRLQNARLGRLAGD